jgi:hypothetical protein
MAPRLHVSAPQPQGRPVRERMFNMRSLRRLAVWGLAATLALGAAVAAGYSETGLRRLMADGVPAQKGDAAPAAVRPTAAELDARRLADAVRALAADRERLVDRIATLERNLEDLTGSISRQNAAPANEGRPADAVAATAPGDQSPAAPTSAAARGRAAKPEEVPAKAEVKVEAKAEFGVDVGGAISFEGLRVLWSSAKSHHAALLDGLRPQVVTRENNRTKSAELRLVVGPLPSIEAAAGICTTLTAARRYCQPVAFEGQQLADADIVSERRGAPERKAEATRERRQAARPRPAAPASRVPRLFQ